jgi:hypothetical protein
MKVDKLILYLLAGIFLSGCAETDLDLAYVCISEEPTFDIEEVSTLEDTLSLPNGHDAIILDYDDSYLPEGGTWRVSSVDVLLMVPASEFEYYPNNVEFTVEVFGGINPTRAPTWRVKQTVDISKLEWTDVRLVNPDSPNEYNQRKAWWTFDFTSVIPESGMISTTFLVGAAWENDVLPTLGYSNYNRPCDRNWTKFNERRRWELNSDRNEGYGVSDICSWPMMRVRVEERHEAENCSN